MRGVGEDSLIKKFLTLFKTDLGIFQKKPITREFAGKEEGKGVCSKNTSRGTK